MFSFRFRTTCNKYTCLVLLCYSDNLTSIQIGTKTALYITVHSTKLSHYTFFSPPPPHRVTRGDEAIRTVSHYRRYPPQRRRRADERHDTPQRPRPAHTQCDVLSTNLHTVLAHDKFINTVLFRLAHKLKYTLYSRPSAKTKDNLQGHQ